LSALNKNKKSTIYKKQQIGIVMAVAIISLLIAGTILAPLQSYARSGNFTDTSSLKHAIRDGVSVNLEHRDQHMDQENLCYRANTCRQSNTGQNTLGNDNSVTGFADQSDNIKQSISPTTPTSANKTTPTPAPTNASLTVIKIVSGRTTATSSNFTMHVTGNNPTPANFAGSTTGIDVTLGAGAFAVTENGPTSSFNTTTTGDCSGTIAAGQHLTCTITNTPKTCEECFTSLLSQTQITTILGPLNFDEPDLATLCLHFSGVTEPAVRSILIVSGIPVATVDELIACLKAAGIVFAV
jgi:hypothetical protein